MVRMSPVPRPPSRRDRLRSWLRRADRSRHRWMLLIGGAVSGAVTAVLLAGAVGLLLQPRFTVLEISAQRLVPDDLPAQPPLEQVGRYAAFDRHYVVRFDTPDGGLRDVVATAVQQRWRVVSGPRDGAVVLEREGVRAIVEATDATVVVDVGVAPSVRAWQRMARIGALAAGALGGAAWVWLQVRRQPRLRTVSGSPR